MGPVQDKIAGAVTLASPTMSEVGHPVLDFGLPYRSLLRFVPQRVPTGLGARFGAPLAPLFHWLLQRPIAELGFHRGNLDADLLRTLMLTAIDDLPASLLREFARWYDTKAMSDRYAMFDFTEHLERITAPLFIVSGSKDELTPARDLEYVYEHVGSRDKRFRVIGKADGFSHDYSHADLVLGKYAPDDVYPLVLEWLEEHREATPKERRRSAKLRVVGPKDNSGEQRG
jgi:pimeloyl-ACP methyl ester carboxylesterase